MKKKKLVIWSSVFLTVVLLVLLLTVRIPKLVLVRAAREAFGISLREIRHSIKIISFDEYWTPINGDGECEIRFKFNATDEFFLERGFEKLPINKDILFFDQYDDLEGFYLLVTDKDSLVNSYNNITYYEILIFNTKTHVGTYKCFDM